MDEREYKDGAGQIKVRAKIKAKDESTVLIKEIPPSTTTESLMGSIEDAVRKGKLKIRGISDFTAESVEIEIRAPQGVSADQLINALYAFTDCEVSIHRISLFDINKHREEVEKVKAELAQTRKDLKNLKGFVIGRIEGLIEKYGPQYPRLTKSSRYDEVEAKDAAFKSFKVNYDRE